MTCKDVGPELLVKTGAMADAAIKRFSEELVFFAKGNGEILALALCQLITMATFATFELVGHEQTQALLDEALSGALGLHFSMDEAEPKHVAAPLRGLGDAEKGHE